MTKIYFASPLFSQMELRYNEWLASMIEQRFTPFYPDFEMYVPQRNGEINNKDAYADSRDIAKADTDELLSSDILVAVLDGQTIDVGVATEIGVAYQAGMPIVGLYTDSRQSGGTNTKKLNALQDIAESQFSYINLYTVGLIKLNGRVVSTVDGLFGELDFLINELDNLKSSEGKIQDSLNRGTILLTEYPENHKITLERRKGIADLELGKIANLSLSEIDFTNFAKIMSNADLGRSDT